MDPTLRHDHNTISEITGLTADHVAQLLAGLDERTVVSRAAPPEPTGLPEEGAGFDETLRRFAARWEPGFSASAGPRYWGFVTGGTTPAALAGDWLASAHDQNMASGREASSLELERETLTWLRELLQLPVDHEGVFVSGATMSNMAGMAIGRQWVGEQHGVNVSTAGLDGLGPVTVLSGSPHSGIGKAMSMLGIGRDNLRSVDVLPEREAVDVDALAAELARLDGRAAIVVANAGTVNTADFDDLTAIASLRQRYPFWLHVDAAFGAFAALSSDHAHLVRGLELADSVCVDLHKWLNVPYDSGVIFTPHRDLQAEVFHNDASYLDAVGGDTTFLHLAPENSRRLRALPVWFSLSAYGRAGYAEIVRRNLASARQLGAAIEDTPGYRLLAPVRLNTVCFAPEHTQRRPQEIADALAATGEAFITTTTYRQVPALRAALVNWRTGPQDVARVVRALESVALPAATGQSLVSGQRVDVDADHRLTQAT